MQCSHACFWCTSDAQSYFWIDSGSSWLTNLLYHNRLTKIRFPIQASINHILPKRTICWFLYLGWHLPIILEKEVCSCVYSTFPASVWLIVSHFITGTQVDTGERQKLWQTYYILHRVKMGFPENRAFVVRRNFFSERGKTCKPWLMGEARMGTLYSDGGRLKGRNRKETLMRLLYKEKRYL